jgi:hypothetical protein
MSSDFTSYAIKESREAMKIKLAFSSEVQRTLEALKWDLADNPGAHAARTTREGTAYVYRHPEPPIQITYEIRDRVLFFTHFAAPLRPRRTVFISYSHKDRKWVLFLKEFLKVLETEGIISFWDDEKIKAASHWRKEIEKALDSACAAVLLVSQDFLTSEFIQGCELPALLQAAEQKGAKIFWIPISPSTVFESHKEITQFQSPLRDLTKTLEELPKVKRKKAFVEISARVREALMS